MRTYAIPPLGYSQLEAYREELQRVQKMLGNRVIGFTSPQQVADWLLEMGFRSGKPITAQRVKFWCQVRRFPHVRRVLGEKWFTTSAHVMAWLWTLATYRPLGVESPPSSLESPL